MIFNQVPNSNRGSKCRKSSFSSILKYNFKDLKEQEYVLLLFLLF
jgi:hypothetical protein